MASADPEPLANGTATPSVIAEDTTLNSATKRKREAGHDAPRINGVANPNSAGKTTGSQLADTLKDLLFVLRKCDSQPSILDARIPGTGEKNATGDEPSAKRTKLSSTHATIAQRLEHVQYTDLASVVDDVERVVDEILAPIKEKEILVAQTQYGRPSSLTPAETRLWVDALAFQRRLHAIVEAEKQRLRLVRAGRRALEEGVPHETSKAGAGIKEEEEVEEDTDYPEGKPVLTLFANAPGPKQLFSSFQHTNQTGGSPEIVPPLRESGLPAFISTTNIGAVEVEPPRKGKPPTIGELFGPPTDKYKLQPPKAPKSRLVTTGNIVDFVRVDSPARTSRRNSYNWHTDKMSTGQWLGYGGLDPPREPTSPQARRKQRDRALSTGEAFLAPTDSERVALQQAKDDALWRRAYGSFAPSYDDSNAIVPKDVRNEMWIGKVEERLAQETVEIDPSLLEPVVTSAEERAKEMKEFEEFAQNFDPKLLEWDEQETKKEKEMEDLLQEISELLETLSSHQRIRNTSLNTSARTSVGPHNSASDLIGTPSAPSSAETEVYKTLKLQLAVLINQLPPYAVARLNGDQLEDLNIKQAIVIEKEDARGIMNEDEVVRAAKMQAYAAAAGTQQRAPTNPYPGYNANANSLNQTPRAQQPARPGGPQGYYTPQPQQAQARPPAPLYQRPSSGVQTYSAGYPSTQQRSTNFSQQYANQGGGPQQSAYRPPTQQFYQNNQAASASKMTYGQSYQHPGTSTSARPPYTQTPSGTYNRPPSNSGHYNAVTQPGYALSPAARTASPLQPAGVYNAQARPQSYGTPVASGPTQQGYGYRAPLAPGQQYPPGQQYGAGMGAMGASGYRGIAAQVSPAQSLTPSRAGSGTPQPLQPAGGLGYGQQINGSGK